MVDTRVETPLRLTGGCQCGAVRYAITMAPTQVAVCHCRMCQKAGGGPFMAMARTPREAITWTRGRPATFASSTLATRGFCNACGTPLTYQWRPDAISVTTGSFDDPGSLAPTKRLGMEGLLPWCEHIAGLPGETSDEWLDPGTKASFSSFQHPDHET